MEISNRYSYAVWCNIIVNVLFHTLVILFIYAQYLD